MAALISALSWADQDGASLETDSEASGLGVRSLLTPVVGDVWRTGPGVAGVRTLHADLGQLRDIRVVALLAPRDGLLPEAGATVRVVLAATEGGPALVDEVLPLAMPRGCWCWARGAAVTARHITLTLTSAQPYLQFGRLWAGDALITSRSIGYGQQLAAEDAGSSERAGISGVRLGARGATWRTPAWTLPSLSGAEAQALQDIALTVGRTGQVFAAPDFDRAASEGVLGVFRSPPAPRRKDKIFWSADISLEEDL